MPQIELASDSGLYLGRGFDPILNRGHAQALDFPPPTQVAKSQEATLQLKVVENSRELAEFLQVDLSVSGGDVTAGGSVSAQLVRERSLSSYNLYLALRATVVNSANQIKQPRLTREAADYLEKNGPDRFRSLYGTHYIEGLITGGKYIAVVEVSVNDSEERQSFKTEFSGAYMSISASGEVIQRVREKLSNKTQSVTICRIGGDGDGEPLETDLTKVLLQVQRFPAVIKNEGKLLHANYARYIDNVLMPEPLPPDSAIKLNQRDKLRACSEQYLSIRDYRASAAFVLENFDSFDENRQLEGDGREQAINNLRETLESADKAIESLVSFSKNCFNDAEQCAVPFPVVKRLVLPRMKGEFMSVKELEKKVAELELALARLAPEFDALKARTAEVSKVADFALENAGEGIKRADNTAFDLKKTKERVGDLDSVVHFGDRVWLKSCHNGTLYDNNNGAARFAQDRDDSRKMTFER